MLIKILSRIKRYSELLYKKYYNKKFSLIADPTSIPEGHERSLSLLGFAYFDQEDRVVKNLSKYFLFKHYFIPFDENVTYVNNKKVQLSGPDQYEIKSMGLSNDWIYMVSNEIPKNYIAAFDITLKSRFKEFQVAFRHTNLFKRLRFRIVDTNKLVFEIVNRGVFFNSFITKPYNFELNRKYSIQVIVNKNSYVLMIDNKPELSIISKSNDFDGNEMAIVFWDDAPKSNIHAFIESLKITDIQ